MSVNNVAANETTIEAAAEAAVQTPAEKIMSDVKAQESVKAIVAQDAERPIDWQTVCMSGALAAAAIGLRRTVQKVSIDQHAEALEIEAESQSYTGILAHAVAGAVVTGTVMAVGQKTFLKGMPSGMQPAVGGLVASFTNLGDAIFGDDLVTGATQLFGFGKAKVSEMMNNEVTVEEQQA